MSSAICQNFVQNAWKKELCSNCFKSKDEHNQPTKPKPIKLKSNKLIEGIIKSGKKSKPKHSVAFTKELTKVIGYGGENWSSDGEEEEEEEHTISSSDSEDFSTSDEEEKELVRLTKANTDFNTVSLAQAPEVKKSFTQLLLGKPQVDSTGKKQTLLVQVTPFGEDSPGMKSAKSTLQKPSVTSNTLEISTKNTLSEMKSNVLLTSYSKTDDNSKKEEKSLLEEISETLENGKNPIQIVPRKKIQKEIVLSPIAPKEPEHNKENIENEQTVETEPDKNTEKIKSGIIEKKTSIHRTPVIKRDQEKPVVYQTSTATIELLNVKNNKNSTNKNIINNNSDKKPSFSPSSAGVRTNNIIKTEFNKFVRTELNPKESEPKINETIKQTNNSETTSSNQPFEEESVNSLDINDLIPEEKVAEIEATLELGAIHQNKPVDKLQNYLPQSRELAGEPDGRADSDDNVEPPALPLTPPPPIEAHSSFLHTNLTYDKPKIPIKPLNVPVRKQNISQNIYHETRAVLTTFSPEPPNCLPEIVPKLVKHDSNGSDIAKIINKRKAPKPPPYEDVSIGTYVRTSSTTSSSESSPNPDQRERASSFTSKISSTVSSNPQGEIRSMHFPEPSPRKLLSISTDSLAFDDKKRDKTKGRFSLKKFLRMGSSKDMSKMTSEIMRAEDDSAPQPKPRLVIVHPLDLNGDQVEVVSKPIVSHDHVDYANLGKPNEYSVPTVMHNGQDIYIQRSTVKPPPPPRNLEESKPAHPPKSSDIVAKQKMYNNQNVSLKKADTVYANIGEVRSAITPNKPQRTASMREREAAQQKLHAKSIGNSYECINVPSSKRVSENVYDYINSARSSSPECDSSSPNKNSPAVKPIRPHNGLTQRSESNVDVSGEYYKFQNIPRSMSLTYCGSETESEIYSPYSFYGSESEVADDETEWSGSHSGRTQKLRSRKGRSIVHKNLEDNYGAVVVANHEALAQVLENILHVIPIQPALRGLKTSSNLRWSDFIVKTTVPPIIFGPRAFHQAVWGSHHVSLVLNAGAIPTSSPSMGTFSLIPITEFSDLLPVKYLPNVIEGTKYMQASIAVLPWMQVHTVESYGELLKNKLAQSSIDEIYREGSFMMLQMVNALKILQAQGIEELPMSLTSFVLCKEMEKETHTKLYVLQGLGEDSTRRQEEDKLVSLCSCASTALSHLLPDAKITPLLKSLLNNERAVSLTQVKSVLEFSLWGPSDVSLGTTIRERELALQRWLDLQRATVLHGLVCTKVQLTIYEECHLLFLVRSTAKMMCDASLLLETNSLKMSHSLGH